MSTNARIAIQLSDKPGYYVSVYHHWDGYPQWLGKTLGEHYDSRKLASNLIDGGDMSSCWSDSIWGENCQKDNMLPSIILNGVKIALLSCINHYRGIVRAM